MALKNRIERLEKALGVGKDNALIIIAPRDWGNDSILEVIVDGERRFEGTHEECRRWVDENIGTVKTIIVGEGELED